MEQTRRALPWGWIALFASLAAVAFIGLSRHTDAPNGPAPVALYDPIAGTPSDRAASADVSAGILAMKSPVDVGPMLQHLSINGENLTVVVNRSAYTALAQADQDRIFADVSELWRRTYKKHHAGSLDRSLTVDFIDSSNEIVHHNQLDPE